MEQVARAFEALRQGVTCLGMEYAASPLGVRPAFFVPYPLKDSDRQAQEYATLCSHRSMAFIWYCNGLSLDHLQVVGGPALMGKS